MRADTVFSIRAEAGTSDIMMTWGESPVELQ